MAVAFEHVAAAAAAAERSLCLCVVGEQILEFGACAAAVVVGLVVVESVFEPEQADECTSLFDLD